MISGLYSLKTLIILLSHLYTLRLTGLGIQKLQYKYLQESSGLFKFHGYLFLRYLGLFYL
jgi:hypothetical protein